jgi:predicted metalloprotease
MSFMASDSERKKIFRFTDGRRRVLEHFELKSNILLQMVSCLQFLHFSSKSLVSHDKPSLCLKKGTIFTTL